MTMERAQELAACRNTLAGGAEDGIFMPLKTILHLIAGQLVEWLLDRIERRKVS